MSFIDSFEGGTNEDLSNQEWYPKVTAMYPNLAAALIGEPDWERTPSKRPPMTLMLSVRDGRLRATFSHVERPRMYHCGVSDPSDVLGSLERALAANQGEWSIRRQNGTSGRR
jgi:hypothetical protein